MAVGQRRRARIAAMQALYEGDTSNHTPQDALAHIVADQNLKQNTADFARALVDGVLARRDEIDGMIAAAAPAWPLDQMPPVDRNVLRLAIREMLSDNGAPVGAVINEAVELAKSFGGQKSGSFVNGVLGSIAKQHIDTHADQQAKGRG